MNAESLSHYTPPYVLGNAENCHEMANSYNEHCHDSKIKTADSSHVKTGALVSVKLLMWKDIHVDLLSFILQKIFETHL